MLFSAGTFLYVATMHVLQEVSHGHASHGNHTPETSESNNSTAGQPSDTSVQVNGEQRTQNKHGDRLSRVELAALVTGILSPMLLQLQHSH